jgi:hypothetical protein
MKGKIRQLTLFVLAVFLLSFLAGCINQPKEKEKLEEGVDYKIEAAEQGWNWYINEQMHFKMKYPTDWKDFKVDWYGFSIDDPVGEGFFGISGSTLKEAEEDCGKIDSP